MGMNRKLKRQGLKNAYQKFSKEWQSVKSQQIADLEKRALEEEKLAKEENRVPKDVGARTLGRRPPFKNWAAIVANNMTQAKNATPQDVKEFVEEIPDLDWDEPLAKESD